jgi:hypothetical protein
MVSSTRKVAATKISDAVINAYANIPQVEAIYLRQSDSTFRIWVFTDEQEYDNKLVEQLADRESNLLEMFDDEDILIRHVPTVLYPNHKDLVGSSTDPIYIQQAHHNASSNYTI